MYRMSVLDLAFGKCLFFAFNLSRASFTDFTRTPRALDNLMPRHSLLTLLECFLDNSLALKA